MASALKSSILRQRIIAAAIIVFAVALVAGLQMQRVRSAASGPSPAPFRLLDRNGKDFSDRDLLGRPYAIFFGYTRCPDLCPTTLTKLARLRSKSGTGAKQFRIVFVSVDPQFDTPASVGAYVDLFRADIVGLSGSAQSIEAVAREFGVLYQRAPSPVAAASLDHSAVVYLVDSGGNFRDVLNPAESDETALEKIRRIQR